MQNVPRDHHFVPQFYLSGFSKDGTNDGPLFVLDQRRRTTWKCSVRNCAFEKDFHKIDPARASDTDDPMVVEKKLSILEGKWSAALRTVLAEAKLTDEETFGDLIQFVAFMTVRVPRIREAISGFIDRVVKARSIAMLQTEEGRAQFAGVLRQTNASLTPEDVERVLEFGKGGEYEVNFDQTWHVLEMVRLSIPVMFALENRHWTIWAVEDGAPDLICSDSPVSLTPLSATAAMMPIGLATPNTFLSMPLSRRVALVSSIEKPIPPRRLDDFGVALINSATGRFANQLYSSAAEFVWSKRSGEIGQSGDLLSMLQASGKRDEEREAKESM